MPLQELESRTLMSTLPDLIVGSASGAPTAVVGNGQSLTVNWSVTNQGGDIPGGVSWSDSVYLAPSQTFDPNVDVKLDTIYHNVVLGLNSGSSYSVSDDVTVRNVPTNFLGTGAFLLFVTNDGHTFQESSTTNNVKSVAITLAGAKVDLSASNPTTSKSTAVAGNGDLQTFSWTVWR